MDPNAALANQEELLQEMREYEADGTTLHPAYLNAWADLRESQDALATWLQGGGFQPDWSKYPNATGAYSLRVLSVHTDGKTAVGIFVNYLAGDDRFIGSWLADCDVDANDGRGKVTFALWGRDAKRFASAADALDYYRRQSTVRPLRDDGEPNRPLTAFTVEILPLK